MIKYIKSILFLAIIPFASHAQDSLVTEEVNNIKTLIHYKNGQKYLLQSFDESGNKWQEINYYQDGRGKLTLFSNDGDSLLSCDLAPNGLEEGLCIRWHSNGAKAEESNYRNGLKNGITRQYYENGQLEEEIELVNNEICDTCKWTRWYPNGQISLLIQKSKNQYELFYENGNKKYEITEPGNSIEYYSSGSIFEIKKWANDSSGSYKRYYENGQNLEEGDFNDHNKVTVKNAWNEKGERVIRKGKGKREEVMMTESGPVRMLSYYKKGKIVKMKEIEKIL
ncbi:MAG TPA: hypothetical protein VIK89_08465 [Cytophagaceae bacterium]